MRYNGFTYLISEGFSNVFKNKKGTMTSLITMICAMFMFGAAFAIAYNKTDTVYTSMFYHMLHNTMAFLLSVFIKL